MCDTERCKGSCRGPPFLILDEIYILVILDRSVIIVLLGQCVMYFPSQILLTHFYLSIYFLFIRVQLILSTYNRPVRNCGNARGNSSVYRLKFKGAKNL